MNRWLFPSGYSVWCVRVTDLSLAQTAEVKSTWSFTSTARRTTLLIIKTTSIANVDKEVNISNLYSARYVYILLYTPLPIRPTSHLHTRPRLRTRGILSPLHPTARRTTLLIIMTTSAPNVDKSLIFRTHILHSTYIYISCVTLNYQYTKINGGAYTAIL